VAREGQRSVTRSSFKCSPFPCSPRIFLYPQFIFPPFSTKPVFCPGTKREPTLCAITSFPAKFRDPSTDLPYCSAFAYKEIQRLKRGEYKWSKLVGAYVGLQRDAARGVPVRFLGGRREEVGEKVQREEGWREPDKRAVGLEQVGKAIGEPQKRGESMA
jgi:hypothetical protein